MSTSTVMWRLPSLSELTIIIFYLEFTYLGSEAFIYDRKRQELIHLYVWSTSEEHLIASLAFQCVQIPLATRIFPVCMEFCDRAVKEGKISSFTYWIIHCESKDFSLILPPCFIIQCIIQFENRKKSVSPLIQRKMYVN